MKNIQLAFLLLANDHSIPSVIFAQLGRFIHTDHSRCRAKLSQLATDVASLSESLFIQIHYSGSNQAIPRPPNRETAVALHSDFDLHVSQLIETDNVFKGLVEDSVQGSLEYAGDAPSAFGTVW